jgi:microcin C transport system substrate-binding protein
MRTTSDGYGEFTEQSLRAREYSVDRALDHFARAGFRQRGADGILVDGAGRRLSFAVSTGYRDLANVLTILREEAARAGVEYRIELLDDTASWKKVMEKQHDIDLTAFAVAPEMYPRYWELFHSSGAYDHPFLDDGRPNPARRVQPETNNLLSIADPELDRLIDAYRASGDVAEMKRLAFEIERRLFEDASFSPGFVAPFYRVAYWRWLRWPDDFNARLTRSAEQLHLHWIDEGLRREVTEARRSGATFPPIVAVHDQYRDR